MGKRTATNKYTSHLNRLKRGKKLPDLPQITAYIFEASQTEWLEPFDFPTGISGFPTQMISGQACLHVDLQLRQGHPTRI